MGGGLTEIQPTKHDCGEVLGGRGGRKGGKQVADNVRFSFLLSAGKVYGHSTSSPRTPLNYQTLSNHRQAWTSPLDSVLCPIGI